MLATEMFQTSGTSPLDSLASNILCCN